jgi:fructose/tagatose bisphosphate aldolase
VSGRIIVHSLADARAAVAAAAELGLPVTLMSAPGAGAYAGALWWKALVAAAAADHPAAQVASILDCGEEAGSVLAAFRAGLKHVRFTGPDAAREKLAALAEARGAILEREAAEPVLALDGRRDAAAVCRAFLAGS